MEVAPVAPGRLLDGAGLLVGDGTAAGNPTELVEKLTFMDRTRGGIDGIVGVTLLGVHRRREGDNECQRQRADDKTDTRQMRRHACSS
jgi:hypothetical protein